MKECRPGVSDYTYNVEIFLYTNHGFFQVEIILNVLVSSYSFTEGIDFRRQGLTSADVGFRRLEELH